MNINQIPEIFQSKVRIAIFACLIDGEKKFGEIKEITGATDGNLSVNLSKMEAGGYITIRKDFYNKKPRTRYKLTEFGIESFRDYVELLGSIISGNK